MIENVSTQLTVFHCFAHCLLPGRAFASLYVLLFLEKEAEIGGRVHAYIQCVYIVSTKYQIAPSKAVVGVDRPIKALSIYIQKPFKGIIVKVQQKL